jgi:hypothetical protein
VRQLNPAHTAHTHLNLFEQIQDKAGRTYLHWDETEEKNYMFPYIYIYTNPKQNQIKLSLEETDVCLSANEKQETPKWDPEIALKRRNAECTRTTNKPDPFWTSGRMDSRINGMKYGSVRKRKRKGGPPKKKGLPSLHCTSQPFQHPFTLLSLSLIIEFSSDLIDSLLALYCFGALLLHTLTPALTLLASHAFPRRSWISRIRAFANKLRRKAAAGEVRFLDPLASLLLSPRRRRSGRR